VQRLPQCDEISDNQEELSTCAATVSQLGACLDDLMEVFADLGDSLTCENFGTSDLTPDTPPSCQILRSACPGVVDFDTH
jgi:hypothetical protein